jgi:hypothetical protein
MGKTEKLLFAVMLCCLVARPFKVFSQTDDCPTEGGLTIQPGQMNPLGIQQYLSKYANALNEVEDVICCLPESYRNQFVIMHSSNSAQHSDVFGPRAILFDIEPGNHLYPVPKLQCAISFNGGQSHLGNPHNLELLCDNRTTGELEFFDIAKKNGKFELGQRNPQSCVSCHGSLGKVGQGGLRPIFEDIDQWTRAVQGTHSCGGEETLARALENATRDVFRSNKRYKCLNQTAAESRHFSGQSTSTAPDLTPFDLALARTNARRTARVLKASEKFEHFQYAIVGSLVCFNETVSPRETAWNTGEDLSGWIPNEVLAQMRRTDWLPKEFAESSDLNSLIREKLSKSIVDYERIDKAQIKAAQQLKSGKRTEFDFYRGPLNTCNNMRRQMDSIAPATLTKPKNITVLDRYKAANAVNGFRGRSPNPHFRFLLESRGVHGGDFSMDLVGNSYNRATDLLAIELFANLPPKSKLRRVLINMFNYETERSRRLASIPPRAGLPSVAEMEKIKIEQKRDEEYREKIKGKACIELKNLSFKSLKHMHNLAEYRSGPSAPLQEKPTQR